VRRGIIGLIVLAAMAAAYPVNAETLGFRTLAGLIQGLSYGDKALPGTGMGGFYVQRYQPPTGTNLLADWSVEKLPKPLPPYFAVDETVQWKGKPTLSIRLPEGKQTDSGELYLTIPDVKPHRIYVVRFSHRGDKIAGEYPAIVHIQQQDAAGKMVIPQENLNLLAGTYDWVEQAMPIPVVEGASKISLMIHHPNGTGTFWMSDVVAQEAKLSPAAQVPGQWVEDPGKPLSFIGVIPGTEIVLSAMAEKRGDGIAMGTGLAAPTEWLKEHETGLVLSFRVPLDATGWRWGDSLRWERVIEAGKTYSDYTLVGGKQFREVSRFPMAAVAGPQEGVALAAPLSPPLFTRLRYDAGRYLCAEFDLGLAARSEGENEQVVFSFELFPFAPEWGGRAALASYYRRYPQFFASTAKHGGWWIGPSDKVKDLGDFGLQYAEDHFAHPGPTKANNALGIYTCSYSEPWMWRITASEKNDLAAAQPLTTYLPKVERDADLPATVMDTRDYWPAPRRDSVRAFLNSAIHGPDGKPVVNAVRTYDGTYLEMSTSCLPTIKSERWGEMNRGLLSYQYETQADVARCAAEGAKLDGVYFDSVGNWSDVSAEDHRREHFRFAKFPLTFSYVTGKPVVSGLSAMAEYMQFIRAKGFVTMANSDPRYLGYAAPYLDMLGAGENYDDDFAADASLSHDRAIAYHRSVSFGNSGMLSASPEEAERRFRLLLFYNVFPGLFYGGEESLEQVRPAYRKYVPLMRAMAEAGWEPVTYARTDDPAVWVERYGPAAGGAVYFALRNSGKEARAVTLTVEPTAFGRFPRDLTAVSEVLSGQDLIPDRVAGKVLLRVEVAGEDTAVVKLSFAP
jgi:hypothetical protein